MTIYTESTEQASTQHAWRFVHCSFIGVLISPYLTRKETSSEVCQGRARFRKHRDASCHQVFSCKTRRRRKFTPVWQKH